MRLLLALRQARLLARGRLLLLALQRLALRDRLALRLRGARLASPPVARLLVACPVHVLLLACRWCRVWQRLTPQRAAAASPVAPSASRSKQPHGGQHRAGRRVRAAPVKAVCHDRVQHALAQCHRDWRHPSHTDHQVSRISAGRPSLSHVKQQARSGSACLQRALTAANSPATGPSRLGSPPPGAQRAHTPWAQRRA